MKNMRVGIGGPPVGLLAATAELVLGVGFLAMFQPSRRAVWFKIGVRRLPSRCARSRVPAEAPATFPALFRARLQPKSGRVGTFGF